MSNTPDPAVAIRLPQPVSAPPATRFPIVAALAPVLASLGLFAMTGSPMSLLFAVLGPVTAIASVVDGAIGGRRHARRERARLAREITSTAAAVELAHAAELEQRRAAAPSGPTIVRDDPRSRLRWTVPRAKGVHSTALVTIGDGDARSGLRLDGAADGDELRGLAAAAARLADAPIMADPTRGIGVVGPLPLARAVARGIAIQVIAASPPDRTLVAAAGPAFAAAVEPLPHGRAAIDPGDADSVLSVRRRAEADDADGGRGAGSVDLARIAVGGETVAVAASCDTVVAVDADGAIVTIVGRAGGDAIRVHPVDHEAMAAWCRAAAVHAPVTETASALLPGSVDLARVLDERTQGPVVGVLGIGPAGVVAVDLERQGPHAVVGGTTGSGKSELLVTWVASMAAGASPLQLAVLLVDFKGGAGFAPIARLPHVVGIVTDLDEAGAMRAVGSLRAEMRRRERAIAAAGLREHAPGIGIPRLVIVVDEYAALVDLDAELHALFGDLAARGRSLGIHLIVGTQRPAASVRDAVLANADVRVCLRVRDRADGIALVGSALPAALPAEPRGRAIASIAGAEPVDVQVALADARTIDRIVERWAGSPRPLRPWRDPLPPVLTARSLRALIGDAGDRGGVIGALDRPETQSIEPWTWEPRRDGVLLAVGAPGCGRSGLLAAIAAVAPSLRITADAASAWDALDDLVDSDGDHGGLTLLIDDLDLVLEAFDLEHRQAWLDRLVSVCRRRRDLGIGVAITAAGVEGPVRAIEPLVTTRVVMRMPTRQDHRLAGGDAATWNPALLPGGAIVGGVRAQVLAVDPPAGASIPSGPPRIRSTAIDPGPIAVIAVDPSAVAIDLERSGRTVMAPEDALRMLERPAVAREVLGASTAVVGDAVAWQRRWDALDAIGAHATVLAHGLSIAQLRAVSGRRDLPPPLPRGREWCWALAPGRILRARMPIAAS